jgi:hypothetical protein
MLVVRCQNGVVAWLFKRATKSESFAFCMVDSFSVPFTSSATESWVQSLQTVMAHSAGLRGAVQAVFYMPPQI